MEKTKSIQMLPIQKLKNTKTEFSSLTFLSICHAGIIVNQMTREISPNSMFNTKQSLIFLRNRCDFIIKKLKDFNNKSSKVFCISTKLIKTSDIDHKVPVTLKLPF